MSLADCWTSPTPHRHSDAADKAFVRLQAIYADPIDDPAWAHCGTTNAVSIYSRDTLPDVEAFADMGDEPLDWQLDVFRGESYLPGAHWDIEDIMATITSFGARAVYDEQRFRGDASKVVQNLNATDHLAHTVVKGDHLVGQRDTAQVTTERRDLSNRRIAYVAVMSVVDPLVKETRSHIRAHLNVSGWRLEKVDRAPRPPSPEIPSTTRARQNSMRYDADEDLSAVARRTTAPNTVYVPKIDVSSGLAKFRHRHSTSDVSVASTHSKKSSRASWTHEELLALRQQPGVILGYVLKTSPGKGGSVPTSFKRKLNTAAPQCIAGLIRFLLRYGFACVHNQVVADARRPHIVRADKGNVDILVETYDPKAGRYHLLFRPRSLDGPPTTSIRFHGGSFGEGRFDVTVERATSWRVEHDIPPDLVAGLGLTSPETAHGEGELFCAMPPKGRPRLTQRFSSLVIDTSTIEDALNTDPSCKPGATGGNTLIVHHHQSNAPIEVRINRRPDRAGSLAQHMRDVGAAFCALETEELPPVKRVGSRSEVAQNGLEAAKAALRALRLQEDLKTPRPF